MIAEDDEFIYISFDFFGCIVSSCMFIDANGANKEIDLKVLELSKADPLGNELKRLLISKYGSSSVLCCLRWFSFNPQGPGLQILWMESTRTNPEDVL